MKSRPTIRRGWSFWNLNTPEEFAEAERRARMHTLRKIAPELTTQNRTLRMLYYFLALTAKKRSGQPPQTARPHHD